MQKFRRNCTRAYKIYLDERQAEQLTKMRMPQWSKKRKKVISNDNGKNKIKKFITKQNKLDTLRFITCGSVDDGKSTLLGRMLCEAQLILIMK